MATARDLRALVTPTAVYAASQDWGAEGDSHHDELAARITRAGDELARFMLCAPMARASASAVNPAATGAASEGDTDEDDFVPFAQQLAALGQ
ncbi:MAG TPA: hypothetical protein VGX23_29630 [Actinocrinis sp.]|nr:hypothetical protein [Actinocrinis sp.]